MTKRIAPIIAIGLLWGFSRSEAIADVVVSDTLTLTDTAGLYNYRAFLLESQEPGTITLQIPEKTIFLGLNENGSGIPSDTLTISAFTVSMFSDANRNNQGNDQGESTSFSFKIFAGSDVINCLFISDCLIGNNSIKLLTEKDEANGKTQISIDVPPVIRFLGLGEHGPFSFSDLVVTSAFTVTLQSDTETPSLFDVGESFRDTLNVNAFSDVPEPAATVPLIGLGLAIVVFRLKARRATRANQRFRPSLT